MIFVNFKTYKEVSGENAIKLAHIVKKCSEETGIIIVSAVQATDIKDCSNIAIGRVWAQHVDGVEYGRHTGAILPESVLANGASGTFLNHSEHKFNSDNWADLENTISRCKETGLKTLVFGSNIEELDKIIKFNPDFVSYEPPELIASKDTSVAKANPEIIKEAVKVASKASIPLIVGAGIKSKEDVSTSLSLGAFGIAVSSNIVLSSDPEQEIMNMAGAFFSKK